MRWWGTAPVAHMPGGDLMNHLVELTLNHGGSVSVDSRAEPTRV
jgi:hypothetical protein